MQITEDFDQLCRIVCPYCADGVALRYRPETAEYVHDKKVSNAITHSFCWANGLRKKYQNEKS